MTVNIRNLMELEQTFLSAATPIFVTPISG